ncbi:hypothetical protein IAD21_00667 [Abditibacteriota bacterium]|nr:hypothetical protein IAD21_00667 [Abditibacteriota bacterium]
MPTTPVNLLVLRRVFAAQAARGIHYRLGGKAPTLNAAPAQLDSGIDCSGEVRLLLHQATGGTLTLPDGSWNQRAWCETHLEEVPYSQALHAGNGELFIAFITPGMRGVGRIGHVWLVLGQGQSHLATTMESYGGHGIGSRPANTPVLLRQVHKCFRLPTMAGAEAQPQPSPPTEMPRPSAPSAPSTPALFLNDTAIPAARLENGHYLAPVRDILNALHLAYSPDAAQTTPMEFYLKVWPRQ